MDDYKARMDQYVRLIGRENLRQFMPAGQDDMAAAWLADRNLNSIPLARWEAAAGYPTYKGREKEPPRAMGMFPGLLASKGVRSFSMSEAVGILKHAAMLDALDRIRDILHENGLLEHGDEWAVFQNVQENPDAMNRYNIFDFECVATFPTEQAARDFESQDRPRRVAKRVSPQAGSRNKEEEEK